MLGKNKIPNFQVDLKYIYICKMKKDAILVAQIVRRRVRDVVDGQQKTDEYVATKKSQKF